MKVVVIGMGRQGKRRAEFLAQTEGISEVWAFDSDAKQLEGLPYKIAVDYVDPMFDAGVICAPSTLHPVIAKDLLDAGKHVLIEKPLAIDVARAENIVRLAEEKKLGLHIGLNMRYRAPIIAAKGMMDRVGNVTRVTARIGHSQFLFDKGPRKCTSGGPLLDVGTHALDVCLYLLGYPGVLPLRQQNPHDAGRKGTWGTVEVEAMVRGGINIRVEASHDEWRPGVGAMFDFHGSIGRLRIDMGDSAIKPRDRIELCTRAKEQDIVECIQQTFSFPDDCWKLDCQAFVQTCRGEIPSNARQALTLVRLLS